MFICIRIDVEKLLWLCFSATVVRDALGPYLLKAANLQVSKREKVLVVPLKQGGVAVLPQQVTCARRHPHQATQKRNQDLGTAAYSMPSVLLWQLTLRRLFNRVQCKLLPVPLRTLAKGNLKTLHRRRAGDSLWSRQRQWQTKLLSSNKAVTVSS